MTDSPNAPFEPLTEREQDILNLLVEGLTDREIAERLFIAYSTVKWYNRQIFNKFGVDNRKAAIERAQQTGLVAGGDAPAPLPPHNLPAQTTPFVGRQRELVEISRLLGDDNVRLVTVLAQGGMGKTRLALAAAEQQLAHWPDGVYFVALVALNTPDDIIPTIAQATGYPFQRDQRTAQQQLLDYLSDKRLLLVLDNFEHLLDGATLVTAILEAAPQLKILVTSRERLNISGETVYALGGMSFPQEALDNLMDYGAVQLFVKCAQRVRPDYQLNGDAAAVLRVCRLIQGMPLAIELASAWLEVLSPQEIADEIALSLDFLSTMMRDVPERQRSVRAVFESSWRRLTADERNAFMKLSVFRGGCTRRAALVVAGVQLRILSSLADKALLKWLPHDERYTTHELLRQYAAEELERAGLAEPVCDAHAAYFLRVLAEHEAGLKSSHHLASLRQIDVEFENIRAGWLWASTHAGFDHLDAALEALYWYGTLQMRRQDVYELLRTALECAEKANSTSQISLIGRLSARCWLTPREGRLRLRRAYAAALRSESEADLAHCLYQRARIALASQKGWSHRLFARAYQAYCELNDPFYRSAVGANWVSSSIYTGHFQQGEDICARELPSFRQTGHPIFLGDLLYNYASLLALRGAINECDQYYAEARTQYLAMNQPLRAGNVATWGLSFNALRRGEYMLVRQDAEELLRLGRIYHDTVSQGRALTTLCAVALVVDDAHVSLRLGSEALNLLRNQINASEAEAFCAVAAAVTGDWVCVQQACQHLLKEVVRIGDQTLIAILSIPTARLLEQRGQAELALQMLRLARTCPASAGRWGEDVIALYGLENRLRNTLTPQAYAAAWERGTALDWEAVLVELGEG